MTQVIRHDTSQQHSFVVARPHRNASSLTSTERSRTMRGLTPVAGPLNQDLWRHNVRTLSVVQICSHYVERKLVHAHRCACARFTLVSTTWCDSRKSER